jgi:hypothetical protein
MIAGLIVMAVFAGTAAANGGGVIYGSCALWNGEHRHNFTTTNNLYAWGDFGEYSYTYGNQPCPAGCGGRIYVVEHKEIWTNGDALTDVSSDGYETVPWGNLFFEMAWPKHLTAGTYDLILDLDVSGTENYYVWTNITNPTGCGEPYITDPIWTITVTGPLPPVTEDVYVDIKPSSCPNPINLNRNGVMSVAVLGTDEFDVATIDPSTILLMREGVGGKVVPLRWSYEDVATPYEGEDDCGCHELGGDGYVDLTLKFETQDLVSTLNLDEVVGETIPLTLTGNLNDGTPFEGQDCVWVLETDKK